MHGHRKVFADGYPTPDGRRRHAEFGTPEEVQRQIDHDRAELGRLRREAEALEESMRDLKTLKAELEAARLADGGTWCSQEEAFG